MCTRCGEPVERPSLCPDCRRHPPAFELARSVFVYQDPLRTALHALKYRRRRDVAQALGPLLAAGAPEALVRATSAVVPVPLHPARLAARGYNQAELLARHLAERHAIPLVTQAVRRLRQEGTQAGAGRAGRRVNVTGVFKPGGRVSGTVLLVDDVFSTGATADACARALRLAGAERVIVLTLARAVLNSARITISTPR